MARRWKVAHTSMHMYSTYRLQYIYAYMAHASCTGREAVEAARGRRILHPNAGLERACERVHGNTLAFDGTGLVKAVPFSLIQYIHTCCVLYLTSDGCTVDSFHAAGHARRRERARPDSGPFSSRSDRRSLCGARGSLQGMDAPLSGQERPRITQGAILSKV